MMFLYLSSRYGLPSSDIVDVNILYMGDTDIHLKCLLVCTVCYVVIIALCTGGRLYVNEDMSCHFPS